MQIIYRLLAGIAGLILGVVVAVLVKLFSADGLQLLPVTDSLLMALGIGGVIGFAAGIVFYKVVGKVFDFLTFF